MTVVLGIDTATADAAVGLTRDGELIREVAIPPAGAGGRHSQVLLAEIERCIDAGGGWEAVGRIAVGVGPGSFTGLRIRIATARALAGQGIRSHRSSPSRHSRAISAGPGAGRPACR
jgi:tRNA threonylcarbamoyladenosine biosynthesis protein TsaB